MKVITSILCGLIALLHLYFLILEMFLWETDFGLRTFGMTPEIAATTATLAMNQGLYNGFLAAGLIWSFFVSNEQFKHSIRIFFLSCIIIAGIFGAMTAKFSILYIQAFPAMIAILFVMIPTRE